MEPMLYKKTIITKEYYKSAEGDDEYEAYPIVPGQTAQVDSVAFTDSIVSYYDSYAKKIAKMINETTGTDEALSLAEEEMFDNIWTIGTIVRPYYSAEFAEKLVQMMRAFALAELQVIGLIRSGLDIKTWTDFRINNLLTTDISILLNTYNNAWNQLNVKALWTQITTAWTQAIKAKQAKDTAGTIRNIEQANALLASFANILAQGIVQQNADKFYVTNPTA